LKDTIQYVNYIVQGYICMLGMATSQRGNWNCETCISGTIQNAGVEIAAQASMDS